MTNFRRFFPALTLLLWFFTMACDAFAYGMVPVMNYQRGDYSFGTQNWDMTQDQFGRVYIANYNGMMAFDGQRWNHYYLPNYSTVRCLWFDKESNRIYAGGSEEFGFFSPNSSNGELTYQSLYQLVPENLRVFSEVWDIIKVGSNIVFRCDNCILGYKDERIEKLNIPGRIATTALVGRKIYIGMEDGKIFSIKDGNFGSLQEEGVVEGLKIASILPYEGNSLIICTPLEGLYILNRGRISPYEAPFSEYLKQNQIFCGAFKNGIYTFGTVTGGALVVDTNNGETNVINKDSGLKNNTVLKARFDRDNNLWLCLDNGVAYAALDSPCRRLLGDSDFIGAGYASARIGNKLLLGTNQGLYYHEISRGMPSSGYKLLLPGQVWSITEAHENLFISTDRGLFLYDGVTPKKIEGMPGVFKTLIVPGNPDRAIASTYDSFHLLIKTDSGWRATGKISGGKELKGDFLIDDYKRVWLPHWQKGIYQLTFNPAMNRFTSCHLYNSNTGLPADDSNTLAFFEGNPISSTYGGFFSLNPEKVKSIRNDEMSELLSNGRRGHLKELPDGSLVMVNDDGLLIITRNQDGNFEKKEISGPGLYKEILAGFTDIQKISSDQLLVSTQSGFTLVNTKKSNRFTHDNSPFVSNIYANRDSLIYKSPFSPDDITNLEVDSKLNSLKFEFAYPECSFGENTEFSTFLENYDKDWSPYSPETFREYTRLSEGKYKLHIKVKDNYSGEVLESAFGFSVNPPWFRSAWAKGFYTLCSFVFLFLIFISVRKKMLAVRQNIEIRKENELEQLRKESERDAMLKDMEIAGLKNEQLEKEIKHKSDELSATTMSLISKNESLREIGAQISKIQKMSSDTPLSVIQKNLSKLQSSIEENISKDSDWSTFNKNFEIVYGDYMKRILQIHPELSQSEKRLCCYLRMGLSSKEIAPLINISFKSVEMARYRLRKKLNLTTEANLSEYLANI